MSIDMLRQQRRKKKLHKWVTWAMMAEAFLIPFSQGLATVALMLGILLTAWRFRAVRDTQFRHLPFDVPVALFVLLGAASVAVSPDAAFSFYNYYNLVGLYAFTYLLVGQNVRDTGQVKKIVLSLGAAALLVVFYGFHQYIFGIDISDMKWVDGAAFPELTTRVFSTWENPNILAGYLDVVLCVLLGFFAKSGNKAQKAVLVLGMALAAACLAMTYARGACLAVAVVFMAYGLFKDRRFFLVCLVAGGALLLLDSALSERLFSVFTTMDTSSEMRLAFWEATVAMIQDHPFLGIGWGAYWMVYPEYDFYMQGVPIKIVHAHNLYLNYMAEIGIAGAVAFFWYFFGTMLLCLRAKIFPKPEILPESSPKEISEEEDVENFHAVLRGESGTAAAGEEDMAKTDDAKEETDAVEDGIGKEAEPTKEEEAPENAARETEEETPAVPGEEEKTKTEEEGAEEPPNAPEGKEEGGEGTGAVDESEDATVKRETAEEAGEEAAPGADTETGEAETDVPQETGESQGGGQTDAPELTSVEEEGQPEVPETSEAQEAKEEEGKKEETKKEEMMDTEGTEAQENAPTADEIVPEPSQSLEEHWQDARTWEDDRLRAGLSLGIGLAFVSVALNGLTDDLLFNIPTSMLFWLLAALGAVNVGMDEKENA